MAKNKSRLKIFAVVLAVSLTMMAYIYKPPSSYGMECHVILCKIEGKNCVCCIETSMGGFSCTPCGAFDCNPPQI
jgi:hypothetical protein